VSNSHRSTTQLVESNSILAAANLIVLEAPAPRAKFGEQIKPALEKTTRAASFWRVGRDFRAALWAGSECADHCRRLARLPLVYCVRSYRRLRRTAINREADPVAASCLSRGLQQANNLDC